MKVILSPAKQLNVNSEYVPQKWDTPALIESSAYLAGKLKKMSPRQIGKLMSISPDLAQLNFERFQNWTTPFSPDNAIAALYIFNGEAYRGLDAASFNKKDIVSAQSRLRILSGLYGLLKPNDLIQPYRLEMGTRMKVTTKKTNLYKYWGDTITDQLSSEMEEDEVLVNLASKEYFKALDFNKLNRRVVTCHFQELRNGKYQAIMTFAKNARGAMTRYIIKNKLNDTEDLKGFNLDNYSFDNKRSSENDFYFIR